MAGNHDDRKLDAEGIPDLETPINDDEGIIPPGDAPIATDEWGVTAAQERLDEPIAERVTREVPDLRPDDIDADDDYYDDDDDDTDVIASLVGDDVAPSAEESAMHITDQP